MRCFVLFSRFPQATHLYYLIVSAFFFFFAYFTGVWARWTCCEEKSDPKHRGHICALGGAAATQLALLSAPCLHPVVCQAAKRGKRWDKWLFMICHLPSSQLSPDPIHYSCRLPLRGRKYVHTYARIQMLSSFFSHLFTDTVLRQASRLTKVVYFSSYLYLSR